MRLRTTTATVTLLLLTAACSSDNSTEPEPSTARSAKPAAEPKDPGPYDMGHTWKWRETFEGRTMAGTTAVIGYEQPVKASTTAEDEFGQDGYVWSALEVKVCITKGNGGGVSNTPWSLAYKDGARVEPSGTTYGDFPKPEYPITGVGVKPGDCVRGKIVYAVPGDERPERVIYAPEDGDEAEWSVPKG